MKTSWLHRLHTGEDPDLIVKRGMFRYTKTVEPSTEPVTLSEAKLFARIDNTTDDALITALIIAARENVEKQTGRSLIAQEWKATLDFLPNAYIFELINRPLISVTSIKAHNEDGTSESVASGDIIVDEANGRVSIINDATVTGDRRIEAFEVIYVSGYGASASDVPEWAKLAVKQMVAHWYENREAVEKKMDVIPFGAQLLIDQNMVVEL